MRYPNLKISVISLFLWMFCLSISAGEQNAADNIPDSVLENQLVRHKFSISSSSPTVYSITKEEDFYKVDYSTDVRLNILADITLAKTVSISSKHSVTINGNGHTIRDGGKPLTKIAYKFGMSSFAFNDSLTGREMFVKDDGTNIALNQSDVYQAQSWSYDDSTGLCTMILPKEMANVTIKSSDNVLIAYELWFVRQMDKVESAKGGILKFYCRQQYKPTAKIRKTWTPQPMIFLINYNENSKTGITVRHNTLYANGNHNRLARCTLGNLLCIQKGTVALIDNLKFTCTRNASLLNYGTLKVMNCDFGRSNGSGIRSSNELFVEGCNFHDIRGASIYLVKCSYGDITNSTFVRNGLAGSNNACIQGGAYIYVENNTFTDFNYSAIMIGNISTSNPDELCSVTVENNTFTWTPGWTALIRKYGLRDSGAIYVGTNNLKAIIRNNTITDFGGHGHNRAIFCDDGAYNLAIYNNTITGTANSYDIDSRDCSKKQIRKVPQGYFVNTNNYICHNRCSGSVRLVPSSLIKNNGCQFRDNGITIK